MTTTNTLRGHERPPEEEGYARHRLPQLTAAYSKVTLIRHPGSVHLLQPGSELIIAAEDWPRLVQALRTLTAPEEA